MNSLACICFGFSITHNAYCSQEVPKVKYQKLEIGEEQNSHYAIHEFQVISFRKFMKRAWYWNKSILYLQ